MERVVESNVAKFGGTSMAVPELVRSLIELPANDCDIVCVSAPGVDSQHPVKTTELLVAYRESEDDMLAETIQSRFVDMLASIDPDSRNQQISSIVEQIPKDLSSWVANSDSVEALGEYWSAKIFAEYTGRFFVDARELVKFNRNGLDMNATSSAVAERLEPGTKYVIPGFYGETVDGRVATFERGGSDVTGALLALVLHSEEYHNWTDVSGLMTADPNIVANTSLVPELTYREARELANGGMSLLHRSATRLLAHSDVKTVIRNTFGNPSELGTSIVVSRDWKNTPIVGVAGRPNMIEVSLHQFGLREGVGATVKLYESLNNRGVPYEHTTTATDDVSVFILDKYREQIDDILYNFKDSNRMLRVSSAGMIHVVGEGLSRPGPFRLKALGEIVTELARAGLSGKGLTDVAGSAALTLFLHPQETEPALKIAHKALGLGVK